MDNAGTSTESDRGLLEPALERSSRFIFDHARRQRFRPERKVVADSDRASDKFDVASERARCQIQCVIDQEPPRCHEWALPHIEGVREAESIYKVILVSEKDRLDIGIDYFDMPNSEGHAGLVVLCDFSREFEPPSQFELGVAVEPEIDSGEASSKRKIGIKEKWILVQNLASVCAL